MASFFDQLPPSLRTYLRSQALRRGVGVEELVESILAGRDVVPSHVADLIREIHRQWRRGAG